MTHAAPHIAPQITRKPRWAIRVSGGVLAAATLVFVAGFLLFLSSISEYTQSRIDTGADGIVVLTGGHQRIDEAVRLLDARMGERLLISGVHPSASRNVLKKTFAEDDANFACCVDVDREALDTIGNAVETARWASAHGFRSVIVVTNDYHMPRSLLELQRTMEGVELIPHAVVAAPRENTGFRAHADRYRVLLGEYMKYAASRIRGLVPSETLTGPHTQKALVLPDG